jgi:hypothetical protein
VNLADLRAQAFELGDGSGRRTVPEPAVKRWLSQQAGLAVPAGLTIGEGELDPATWGTLREPLVLKAFGPGLVHKSDAGAVALGLHGEGVVPALERMADALAVQDLKPAGYLIEEQRSGGIELIVGLLRHPLAGPLVLLGHGGVLAELLGPPVMRPLPVSARDAQEMVSELAAQQLLEGVRGSEAIDRGAISSVLQAFGALAESLGDELAELECNPVLAGPCGVVALDARLILGPTVGVEAGPPATDFSRLFAPRSIAVAGA